MAQDRMTQLRFRYAIHGRLVRSGCGNVPKFLAPSGSLTINGGPNR